MSSNLKLLVVTPTLPYPYDKDGFTLTLGHLIEGWIKLEAQVDILNYGNRCSSAEKYFSLIGCNVYNESKLLNSNRFNFLKLLILPRNMLLYENSKFLFNTNIEYDLVIYSRFESALFIDKLEVHSKKNVYFELDAISLYYKRSYEQSKSVLDKLYNKFQQLLTERIEEKAVSVFDKICFLSSDDKNYIMSIYRSDNIINIRNGVDFNNLTHSFKENKVNSEPTVVTFSGDYKYKPNHQSAMFIINKILPIVKENGLNLLFVLVGRNPSPEMKARTKQYPFNLKVTGEVDCVDSALIESDIYISPLFVGSGIKNKILNVMKLGIPFIATKLSVEGIDELCPGHGYEEVNSRNPNEWIDAICNFDANMEIINQKAKLNMAIIKQNYQWLNISKEFILKSIN